jgi:hypothetical protein
LVKIARIMNEAIKLKSTAFFGLNQYCAGTRKEAKDWPWNC